MSPKAQVDDHVDPSPETSSQLPPSDPFPLPAAATYSPIEIEQLAPGPLQNGPIDTAPNSSSHPSTGSIETPYDPTHVTPSGSSFIKPIQRNLPAEPPTNHDPSIDKTTKTERDVTIHTCSSDHRTVTAITEHLLRRHQFTDASHELNCPIPKCGRTFYRNDLLERHLQRHDIDSLAKNHLYQYNYPKLLESEHFLPFSGEGFSSQINRRLNNSGTVTIINNNAGPVTIIRHDSSTSPNHPPKRDLPTEDNFLKGIINKLWFGKSSTSTVQPTSTVSSDSDSSQPRMVSERSPTLLTPNLGPRQDNPTVPTRNPEDAYSTLSDYECGYRLPDRTSSGEWNKKIPIHQTVNKHHSPVLDDGVYRFPLDDSDESDVESVMSNAPSLASSFSSVGEVWGSARTDLTNLLLSDDDLRNLFSIGICRVGADKFQRNVRRLLMKYGRALRLEAVKPSQRQAAQFVRIYSAAIAAEIKEAVMKDLTSNNQLSTPDADQHLNYYLDSLERDENEFVSSDEEFGNDRDNQLQTLEAVKNFLISSNAFVEFHKMLRQWLNIDPRLSRVSDILPDVEPEAHTEPTFIPPSSTTASDDGGSSSKDSSGPFHSENLENNQPFITPIALDPNFQEPTHSQVGSNLTWVVALGQISREYRNLISDYMQPKVSLGNVRVSWTCRCGKRLRIDVPRKHEAAVLAFAQQASGSQNIHTISSTSSSSDDESHSGSSSAGTTSSRSSNTPSRDSPNTEYSTSMAESSTSNRFYPRGTNMYMLLCVNTGMRLIKLANVNVTDMDDDKEVFDKLRRAYRDLRKKKWYSHFLKPKTMHYIKFQLLCLKQSKECVTHFEVDSIPSIKEIMRGEYLYNPCPPQYGNVPIPPDIFMHLFENPGDHIGIATEMLPKRLHSELRWIDHSHNSRNLPYGWGFYIVEDVDWALVAWLVIGLVICLTILTIGWCTAMKDVQGGTGIGSYSIGVLAVLMPAVVLGTRAT